jgi:hypothetical protein
MYSLNVKSHLEGLLASYLSAFVEEYDSTSLSIGIWQGHIKLTNLKLKPQAFDAMDDLPVKLEYGAIGEMQIIVPWTQLQSGNITVIVDKVHVVVRCFAGGGVSATDAGLDSLALQGKLTRLDAQERSMLGGGGDRSPSFMSRIIESFTSSLKSNVMNGISISVSDVKVSVLCPLDREGEVLHARLGAESLCIKKHTSEENFHKKNSEYSFKKHIELHGISLEISCKPDPRSDKEAFYSLLGAEPARQLVLNPVHLDLFVSLSRQQQPGAGPGPGPGLGDARARAEDSSSPPSPSPQTLSVDCNISHFELTPHLWQLHLLREGADRATGEMARRFGGLRPAHPPSAKLRNSRAWWRYSISAVLRRLYGDSFVFRAGSDPRRASTQRSLRNRYIFLYCQLMEGRILRLRAGTPATDPSGAQSPDCQELAELHMALSFDKLLLYRAIVHQNLQNLGYGIEELRRSVSNSLHVPSFWSSLMQRGSKDRDLLRASAVDDDIDSAILNIFTDIQMKEADRKKTNQLMLDFSVTVPRLAISLLEDSSFSAGEGGGHADGAGAGTALPSCTMVLYGCQASYEQGEQSGDEVVNLRLGAARLYGTRGVELLSCGPETDAWLYNFSVQHVPARDLALSLQLQWFVLSSVRDADEDSDCAETTTEDAENSSNRKLPLLGVQGEDKTHVVLEVSVSPVVLCFDESSLLFLCSGLADLSAAQHPGGEEGGPEDPAEAHPFREARQLCARHSVNNPRLRSPDGRIVSNVNFLSLDKSSLKWSVNLSFRGLQVNFPFCTVRPADCCDSQVRDAPPPRGHLEVSLGSLQVQSGDFLQRYSRSASCGEEEEERAAGENSLSDISTRSIWPEVDRVMAAKLRRVQGALLTPAMLSLGRVDISLVGGDEDEEEGAEQSRIRLTKVPWSVRGLVTPCAVRCHKMHPDLQVEVYCSPLQIQCNPQVMCIYA